MIFRLSVFVFLISFLFTLEGCNCIKNEEVIGKWHLVESKYVFDKKESYFEFKSDNSFIAHNVFGEFISDTLEYVSADGIWSLENQEGNEIVALRFKHLTGLNSEFYTNLNISCEFGNLYLYFFVGDPDLNERIRYAKT